MGETRMNTWAQRGSATAIVSSILLLVTSILFYVAVKQGTTIEQEGAYSVLALVMMIVSVITLSLGAYATNTIKNENQVYLQQKAKHTQS